MKENALVYLKMRKQDFFQLFFIETGCENIFNIERELCCMRIDGSKVDVITVAELFVKKTAVINLTAVLKYLLLFTKEANE
jgi:hypothetical protein